MPNDGKFPAMILLHKRLQLCDYPFGKIDIKQTCLLFGFIAQIAVFAAKVAGIGGFEYKIHINRPIDRISYQYDIHSFYKVQTFSLFHTDFRI